MVDLLASVDRVLMGENRKGWCEWELGEFAMGKI